MTMVTSQRSAGHPFMTSLTTYILGNAVGYIVWVRLINLASMVDDNMTCTLFGGDNFKCNVVIALKRTTGSLSLIGCVFMIATIWLFRKYNVLSQRLVLYLSIAALLDTIGYLIGDMTPKGPQCSFEAWWMTYFDWTVLMWVTCLTVNLFINVVKQRRTEKYEKVYHLLCWVIPPLLLSLLPLISHSYGPAGAWCWIVHDAKAWRFVIWYVPLFIIIIGLFVSYGYIIWFLRRRASSYPGNYNPDMERDNEQTEEDIKVLKAYPFVYLILSIFPLILRIHNAFTEEGNDVYALWILTALTAPLQGAVNALVFGFDPDTRSKLTLAQIKLAWSSRFGAKSTIREYPTLPGSSSTANLEEIPPAFDALPDHGDVMRRSSSLERRYGSLAPQS